MINRTSGCILTGRSVSQSSSLILEAPSNGSILEGEEGPCVKPTSGVKMCTPDRPTQTIEVPITKYLYWRAISSARSRSEHVYYLLAALPSLDVCRPLHPSRAEPRIPIRSSHSSKRVTTPQTDWGGVIPTKHHNHVLSSELSPEAQSLVSWGSRAALLFHDTLLSA